MNEISCIGADNVGLKVEGYHEGIQMRSSEAPAVATKDACFYIVATKKP